MLARISSRLSETGGRLTEIMGNANGGGCVCGRIKSRSVETDQRQQGKEKDHNIAASGCDENEKDKETSTKPRPSTSSRSKGGFLWPATSAPRESAAERSAGIVPHHRDHHERYDASSGTSSPSPSPKAKKQKVNPDKVFNFNDHVDLGFHGKPAELDKDDAVAVEVGTQVGDRHQNRVQAEAHLHAPPTSLGFFSQGFGSFRPFESVVEEEIPEAETSPSEIEVMPKEQANPNPNASVNEQKQQTKTSPPVLEQHQLSLNARAFDAPFIAWYLDLESTVAFPPKPSAASDRSSSSQLNEALVVDDAYVDSAKSQQMEMDMDAKMLDRIKMWQRPASTTESEKVPHSPRQDKKYISY